MMRDCGICGENLSGTVYRSSESNDLFPDLVVVRTDEDSPSANQK
jgi:hypothetical protein